MTDLDAAISQIEAIFTKLKRVHKDLNSERLRRVHASNQEDNPSNQSSETEGRPPKSVSAVATPVRPSERTISSTASRGDRGYGSPNCLGDII
jgi:hypothetical protein